MMFIIVFPKSEVNKMTLYSILVSAPNNENTVDTYAADWGRLKGLWTTSYKEYGSNLWRFQDDFYAEACRDVLKAFGLVETDFEDFSLEKIVKMSPRELAEKGNKNPVSDTIGDKRCAWVVK